MRSVEAIPRSTTSTPCERTPSANAPASSGPSGRMSRATSTVGAPAKRANAAPTARHNGPSIWSGTVPRMSYALKTASRSPIGRSNLVPLDAGAAGRGLGQLVLPFAGPAPDAEEIAHEPGRVAHDVHRGPRRVRDGHRNLGEREPVALDDDEEL